MIFIISTLQGVLEGILLSISGTTGDKIFLNHFSVYHLILALFFIILSWGRFKHLPILILIQDLASNLTMGAMPQAGDWITWPTYQLVFNLPLVYWLLSAIWIILLFQPVYKRHNRRTYY